MQSTIINLTVRALTIQREDGVSIAIPPDGEVLRVATESFALGETPDAIPVNEVRPAAHAIETALALVRGKIAAHSKPGRPAIVIVSGIALDWIGPHLADSEILRVLAPDTSYQSAVRAHGKIAAIRALRASTGKREDVA